MAIGNEPDVSGNLTVDALCVASSGMTGRSTSSQDYNYGEEAGPTGNNTLDGDVTQISSIEDQGISAFVPILEGNGG